MAEQQPEKVLDWWLGGEWENLSNDRYKEPEKIYNPKQLIDFIDQYFNNRELIERITRGKRDGYSDALATKHYDKALGHAVKLREEVPDFPQTPEATGKPVIDLRKFQEWCIECQKIANDLITIVTLDCLDKALSLLRELSELLDSGFPPINQTKWDKIKDRIWSELERLPKVIDESGKSGRYWRHSIRSWRNSMMFDQDYELFLNKLVEHKIHAPDDKEELIEMLNAAEWMAKVDWDKVKAIVEDRKNNKAPDITSHEQIEQMSLLRTAQMAEQKINDLVWKAYCLENKEYAEAVKQTDESVAAIFNEAADILNSDKNLIKVAYLREEKLNSGFERLNDRLFGTPTLRSGDDDPLKEIIYELEAIRDDVVQHGRTALGKKKEKKRKVRAKKAEKKFKPWTDFGDARFAIDQQRVKFYHNDKIEDLRLRNYTQTHKLLFYLTSGSMQPSEIKDKISPDSQVTAAKIVEYANGLLNKKIQEVGFTCLPKYDVEFIQKDKFGHYFSMLPIQSNEKFKSWQQEQK